MRKRNKFCSDYYRMTGNIYKPGPKTFLRRYFFHNLQFAFYFRKYKEKENVFSRLVLYRLSRKLWIRNFSKGRDRGGNVFGASLQYYILEKESSLGAMLICIKGVL